MDNAVASLLSGNWRPQYTQEKVSLSLIDDDPQENYRWGSQDALEKDQQQNQKTWTRLSSSMNVAGVQTPVGLTKNTAGRYRVVYGFTRVQLARKLRHADIPANVYADLSPIEAGICQIMENSKNLRRSVNWVQEAERFAKLSEQLYDDLKALPRDKQVRRKDRFGKTLGLKKTAEAIIAEAIGSSARTHRDHLWCLYRLPEKVQALARQGIFSVATILEFFRAGKKDPYPSSEIDLILSKLDTTQKVEPGAVRRAAREVSGEGKVIARSPTALPSVTNHIHPGHAREYAICLAEERLRERGVTCASADAEISRLEKSQTWAFLLGMAVGCGAAHMPAVFEGDHYAKNRERSDAQATAWVREAFLAAMVQVCLAKDVRRLEDWILDNHSRLQMAVSAKVLALHGQTLPVLLRQAKDIATHLLHRGTAHG